MDKTLDDLLHYLKTTIVINEQDYIQYLNAIDIFFFCYGDEKTKIHNYTEPELFLEKLHQDGFVNFNKSENSYQINLNGIEFVNNGGYKSRTRNQRIKKYWNITKIIAIFLNAVILLKFAYFSFIKEQKELKNKNQIEINRTENNIETSTNKGLASGGF